jgi:hypothetical protein
MEKLNDSIGEIVHLIEKYEKNEESDTDEPSSRRIKL